MRMVASGKNNNGWTPFSPRTHITFVMPNKTAYKQRQHLFMESTDWGRRPVGLLPQDRGLPYMLITVLCRGRAPPWNTLLTVDLPHRGTPYSTRTKPALTLGILVSLLGFWVSWVEFVNKFKLTEDMFFCCQSGNITSSPYHFVRGWIYYLADTCGIAVMHNSISCL